jgi:hypothetical protein
MPDHIKNIRLNLRSLNAKDILLSIQEKEKEYYSK